MRRPRSRGSRLNSSTVSRTTATRSTHSSASGWAPSARASASSRSARRARRESAATSAPAGSFNAVPSALAASSCACASAAGDRRAQLVRAVVGEAPLGFERVGEPGEQAGWWPRPPVASRSPRRRAAAGPAPADPARDTALAVRWTCCTSEREARNTMYAANASSAASGRVSHSSDVTSASRRSLSGSASCRKCFVRGSASVSTRQRPASARPCSQRNVEQLRRRVARTQQHAARTRREPGRRKRSCGGPACGAAPGSRRAPRP